MKPFTVCVLLYGDYPKLAERVLRPFTRPEFHPFFDLRVGANAISDATREHLMMPGLPSYLLYNDEGITTKYPRMRQMFHNMKTPYAMWFDDDSWIHDNAPADWFTRIQQALADGTDMLGSIWKMSLIGGQRAFIQAQPWYNGKVIPQSIPFITGGWWAINADIIRKHDWPMPQLNHRGGDVMLGHLMHQQGYRITNFQKFVSINADDTGVCSSSPRRGFDEKPIGVEYQG